LIQVIQDKYMNIPLIQVPIQIQQKIFSKRNNLGAIKSIINQKIKKLLQYGLISEKSLIQAIRPEMIPSLTTNQ